MVHGSEDGHHGLHSVAVDHRLVLGALVSGIAIVVDDPVEMIAAGMLSQSPHTCTCIYTQDSEQNRATKFDLQCALIGIPTVSRLAI